MHDNRNPDLDPEQAAVDDSSSASIEPTDSEDVEGHSATIYRRRRGPYPLRSVGPLPDADDRTRREGSARSVRPTL
jgi:hypothetical protein